MLIFNYEIPDLYLYIAGAVILGLLVLLFLWKDCSFWLAIFDTFWPAKNRLRNKIVWVVGASSGIGAELAYQLAKLNCKLILTSTTESKLEAVKAECLKRSKGLQPDDILVLAYDITQYEKNDEALKTIIEKFGKVDVLCQNAGKGHLSAAQDDDFKAIVKMFDLNYFSAIYLAKIMTRFWLTNNQKGQILVTSSLAAIMELPFGSQYSASKKALNVFFRDVSMQYHSKGIYVSICMPGAVSTPFLDSMEASSTKAVDSSSLARMKTTRCVHLMLVSLAHNLSETWIAMQPALIGSYLMEMFSYCFYLFFKRFNIASMIERNYFKKPPSNPA